METTLEDIAFGFFFNEAWLFLERGLLCHCVCQFDNESNQSLLKLIFRYNKNYCITEAILLY